MSTIWVRRLTNMESAWAACSDQSSAATATTMLDAEVKVSRKNLQFPQKKNAMGHLGKKQ